jgi:hypothetical protein
LFTPPKPVDMNSPANIVCPRFGSSIDGALKNWKISLSALILAEVKMEVIYAREM